MTTKLDWLTQEIDGLKDQGLYNRIRTIGSAQGARIIVDGKDVLNFCSNNYLGLANHPKLVEAAKNATKKQWSGLRKLVWKATKQNIPMSFLAACNSAFH